MHPTPCSKNSVSGFPFPVGIVALATDAVSIGNRKLEIVNLLCNYRKNSAAMKNTPDAKLVQ
jgi:hypothetical protein